MPDDPIQITPEPITPPAPPEPTATPEPQLPTPAEPSIDVEAIKKEVSEGVTTTVLEKIKSAFGLSEKQKEELPTNPEELLAKVREESKKVIQEALTAKETADEKAQQEAESQRQTQITEGAEKFKQLWADQYTDLADQGKVPKITNADDPNDPGNQAKTKILTKLKQILDENEKNGVDYVPTLKEVYYETPNILSTETQAGANVPISGGGRSTTPNAGMSYEQLNKTPIEDMVKAKSES